MGVNILKRISQPTKMKEMINALRYWGEKLGNSSSEHGLGSVYRGAFLALALAHDRAVSRKAGRNLDL